MRDIFKRVIISALIVAMMLPIGSAVAISEDDEIADDTEQSSDVDAIEDDEEEEEERDIDVPFLTEDQALAKMTKVTENDKLAFYFDDVEGHFALVVKENGFIWWSEPINPDYAKNTKNAQINDLKSSYFVRDTSGTTRQGSYVQSVTKKGMKATILDDGVKIDFKFSKAAATVPVKYTLKDDYLSVEVMVKDIKETKMDSIALAELSVLPNFGLGGPDEEGSLIIPDGSGAVINFNNGKGAYRAYSEPVYGKNTTVVPLLKEVKKQQVHLPMFGIVKEDNAVLAVAHKGDAEASINAYVQRQSNNPYNAAYFSFTMRSKDAYYIANDAQKKLDMYESGKIKFDEIEVRYYPIAQDEVDYNAIAKRYRQYLIDEKGVTKKTKADTSSLYLSLNGGVVKPTSVFGIPMNLKKDATTFNQAIEILDEIDAVGVDDVVINYKDWSNSSIGNKVTSKVDPARILGGKRGFNKLIDHVNDKGYTLYPNAEFTQFKKSGNGFRTMFDSSIRLTRAYSRQMKYTLSFGTPTLNQKTWSLLSPNSFNKVFDSLTKSYNKFGLENISLDDASYRLYADYGKNTKIRTDMMEIVMQGYQDMNENVGSVLAESANAYVLPYVDHVTNIPSSSSGHDVFDYDIPLYQMVIQGLIPHSTTPINANADSDELILQAISTGASVHYDFIYETLNNLVNTDYDQLFYANYKGWIKTLGEEYALISEITKGLSDKQITDFKVLTSTKTQTTFEDGTVIIVDKSNHFISVNGKEYVLPSLTLEGGETLE